MKNNLYYQDEYINETFNLKMFLRLLRGAGKNKKMFWGSVALEIFTSALSLVPSVLYSVIVATVFPTDGVFADNYMLYAALSIGGLAIVWIGLSIGYYFENVVPGTFAHRFCKEMREELFNHLTVLSFHYYDTHSTGKILVRVTNYVDEVSELFSNLFYSILYSIGVGLVGLVLIIVLDWRIGGAVVLLFVPFIFVMAVLSKIIHRRAGRDHNKNANYTAFVAENINGAEVVRAYNRGKINGEAAETLFDEYRNAFMSTTRVREAFFPLAHGFTNSVMVLFVYGAALL
ncbi:MAG: ABC transporter ATP-binding protein, partial [Clostridia bacterium]|nr:ABC transporter ATP-binding protein [Clostridia bacterium]